MSSYKRTGKIWFFLAVSLFPALLVDSGSIFGTPLHKPTVGCNPVKRDTLAQRMGKNYNKLFMSDELVDDSPQLPNHQRADDVNVTKRGSSLPDPLEWKCKTHTTWEDLGMNFYPRHLRKTTCSKTTCWFGHFSCKPKVFHVQVLKRKPGKCSVVSQSNGKARFEDYWEFVQKDVTYYCECGH